MVNGGVDLHKRMSQIAVLSDEGRITQRRVPNDAAQVGRFFHGLPPARVAIEASGTWWWLVDLLEELGHQPVLSHPRLAASSARCTREPPKAIVVRLRCISEDGPVPGVGGAASGRGTSAFPLRRSISDSRIVPRVC